MNTQEIISQISIIIPAKNEEKGLTTFLPKLAQAYPQCEIIVVNDGSTDNTKTVAEQYATQVISHPYSIGNGAAIKTGARHANRALLLFMDGDGQHRVEDIAKLIEMYNKGYDMVVGARDKQSQASISRWLGNSLYNFIASNIVGQTIQDLTSGFRIVNREKFLDFLHLLPNGFSYPSTITMAFFRSGYFVGYHPIQVTHRIGKSHLNILTDGIKFLLIIYKMTILYSPFKVFLPFAVFHFLAGSLNYIYTYASQGRFTNMSAVFLSAAVIIFLIGLVSEQITTLMYQRQSRQPIADKQSSPPLVSED